MSPIILNKFAEGSERSKLLAKLFDNKIGMISNHVQHKDTTVAILQSFQEDFEYWGVALKKDSPLKKDVDAFIKKAKADGTFDSFANKYLTDAKKTFDDLGIPFFF